MRMQLRCGILVSALMLPVPFALAQTEEDVAGMPEPAPEADGEATIDLEPPAPEEDAQAGGRIAPRNRLLEEVVVTAQKREQDLQSVPSTVQAFTAGQLEAQGVDDLQDLQLITPGLQFDAMASYSLVFIRGIGSDAYQAGVDSSVATYIDGVYIPFTFSAAQALGDVKQIEVLKGPQGTLYGRNAVAGAIKVELKEPGTEYAVDFLQQFGNYDDIKTKLGLSGPVPFTGDTLRFGVSGLYQQHDAHTTYKPDPSRSYRPYRNAGHRATLLWEPSDIFDIKASYYDLRNEDADTVITVLRDTATLFEALLTDIKEPHQSGNQPNVGVDAVTRMTTVTSNLRWFDSFDIKAVYGDLAAHSTILFDFDGAPEPLLDISAVPNTAETQLVELIFTSNPMSTPDWVEWIGGLYYEDTLKSGRYPIKVEPVALLLGLPGAAQTNDATGGLLGILDLFEGGRGAICDLYTALGGDCDANSDTNGNLLVEASPTSAVRAENYSAYGQLTFHIDDHWSVVAGNRYAVETRDLLYSTVDARLIIPQGAGLGDLIVDDNLLDQLIPGFTTPEFSAISYRPQSHTWHSFTPNFGLNYTTRDGSLFYYRYAEAFKSGNYNGLNVTAPPDRIEPELAASNEVGIKTTLFDDTMKLSAALFTTRVTNGQVQILSLTSGGVTTLQNAGKYTVEGAEFEGTWFPTDSLVFTFSGVFLDGTYDKFIGRGFEPDSAFDTRNDFSGNTTVRTPEFTGTFGINYTFPFFFDLEGEIGSDAYYNSGFYYDPLNTVEQDPYTIVGARLSFLEPRSNVRVTFYGDNLTDEVRQTQAYRVNWGETVIYGGARRTWGVFFTWSL